MRDSAAEPANAETIPDMSREGAYSFAKAPRLAGARGRGRRAGASGRRGPSVDPRSAGARRRVQCFFAGRGAAARNRDFDANRRELGARFAARRALLRARMAPRGMAPVTGFVEAARGALGHWATFRDGHILRYQIVAPTTWNFSPRDANGAPGPLEFALRGLEVGDEGASCRCGAAYRALLRSLHGLHRALIGYSLSAAGNLIFIAGIASTDRRLGAIVEIARELASPMRWPASCRPL